MKDSLPWRSVLQRPAALARLFRKVEARDGHGSLQSDVEQFNTLVQEQRLAIQSPGTAQTMPPSATLVPRDPVLAAGAP
jgi:hypothetical protein